MKKPVLAANWKMYKTIEQSVSFVEKLKKKPLDWDEVNIILCAPYTSLFEMGNSLRGDSFIGLGAQNLHWEQEGAFTGEISVEMLKACGVDWVIIGHSERRTLFSESNEDVCRKADAALQNGLSVIFCVGESLEERENGNTASVLQHQVTAFLSKLNEQLLRMVVFAYEPIWAIGTGLHATSDQIEESHRLIRRIIEKEFVGISEQVPILYGGSVNSGNCRELSEVSEVNGFLIGGASLDVHQFAEIATTITEVKKE
mgnify:CR=1 FL=1